VRTSTVDGARPFNVPRHWPSSKDEEAKTNKVAIQ